MLSLPASVRVYLSIHEKLDALFRRYGCHAEKTFSVVMPGSEGMDRMQAVMAQFRSRPPKELAGMKIARVRDYLQNHSTDAAGNTEPLPGPTGDLVMFDLAAAGNYVAVRPSGTEPLAKFYMFAYQSPDTIGDLEATKADLAARLAAMQRDLKAFAGVG